MTNETATLIIRQMKQQFDSHDFILTYVLSNTLEAFQALDTDMPVREAVRESNRQIGRFLRDQADKGLLPIRYIRDQESVNILGNITPCALWERL